jgi:kumamolisin
MKQLRMRDWSRSLTKFMKAGLAALLLTAALSMSSGMLVAAPEAQATLRTTQVSPILTESHRLSAIAESQVLDVSLVLPLRNPAAAEELLRHVSTPGDPLYGKYLTPDEFHLQFSPSDDDVNVIKAFAARHNLTVNSISDNKTVIHVGGTVADINKAFNVTLFQYIAPDGRVVYGPDREPAVDESVSGRLLGILGLDNAAVLTPQCERVVPPLDIDSAIDSLEVYASTNAGLSPKDIKSVYNLTKASETGSGQVLGVFEQDTYTPSDITTYKNQFGIPNVTVTPVGVNGFNTGTKPGGGAAEVTLDIDMQLALAPGAKQILVYEGAGGSQSALDIYEKIADDNKAKEISTSWDWTESSIGSSQLLAEWAAFVQMALQGQSFFAAAGDEGAFSNETKTSYSLSLLDPASQPYVTAVGGTYLTDTPQITYTSESSWWDPSDKGRGKAGTGGGGGISVVWDMPWYQQYAWSSSSNPQGSLTMRNIPDVSLFGDYDEGGYAIYFHDPKNGAGWYGYNGTSAASPLWSAFAALANQNRASHGYANLGLANPMIYQVAEDPTKYAGDFHDIKDGSTNGYYKAVAGYDDSTGWGSFNGAPLLTDLAAPLLMPATISVTPNPVEEDVWATYTVTLNSPAPVGGTKFTLTSGTTNIGQYTIAAGSKTSSGGIKFFSTGTYSIGAQVTGYKATTNVTVLKTLEVGSVSASPNPVVVNKVFTVTVRLDNVAPTGGAKVALTWAGNNWTSITVPAGATSASWNYTDGSVGTFAIGASYGGNTVSTKLTIEK